MLQPIRTCRYLEQLNANGSLFPVEKVRLHNAYHEINGPCGTLDTGESSVPDTKTPRCIRYRITIETEWSDGTTDVETGRWHTVALRFADRHARRVLRI